MKLINFTTGISFFLFLSLSLEAQIDTASIHFTQFFYPSGVLSSEGSLINGKPEGYWKTYYELGSLKTEGNRSNGLLQDEWKFYREDGKLERILVYENDLRKGIEMVFSENGNLIAKIPWVEDLKRGEANYFYESGELYRTLSFLENKEEGRGFEYAKDGRIITYLNYNSGFIRSIEKLNRKNKTGKKTGYWVDLYPNGKVEMDGYFTNGIRNGIFKFYDKRDNLDRIEKYVGGELIIDASETVMLDIRKEYYPGGGLKLVGSYRDGSKQGVFREYDKGGKITTAYLYDGNVKLGEGIIDAEGREQGPWKLFYPTGELKAEGAFIDGKREGPWSFFFVSGKKEQKGNYRGGLANGSWTWFFESGETEREEGYRRGKEDGLSIEYNSEGSVLEKGEYIDGLKNGPWLYHVNDHKEEVYFIDGEPTGDWLFTHENGNKLFKGSYLSGIPIGKHKYWYANGNSKEEGKYQSGEKEGNWKYYDEVGALLMVINFKSGEKIKIDGAKLPQNFEE